MSKTSGKILAKAVDLYFHDGYYTVNVVRGFFKQSNYDKNLIEEGDFEAITGISFEFYNEHKEEIGGLKYQAFQAWMESYKVEHQKEIIA